MVAYELYKRDKTNLHELIGILPERRKTPERITPESIINWGKEILGDDVNNIFYITKTIYENIEEI